MSGLEFSRRDLAVDLRIVPQASSKTAEGADWEPPVPLTRDVAAFPVETLPAWLAAYVTSASEAFQVPPDLPGMLGLAVIALTLARKVITRVKPGWSEPLNLYVIVALLSGERKSPPFRQMLDVVFKHQMAEIRRLAPSVAVAREHAKLGEERLRLLRRRAAEARPEQRSDLEGALAEAASALADTRVLPEPLLVTADATPEALALRLYEQGGRLGLFSTEGGPLEIVAGRYSSAPNLELLLQAHSGDPYVVDRIGRRGFTILAPALTMGLLVQPSVITGLAAKPGFRGKGLLARFLYALPASRVGRRNSDSEPTPPRVLDAYENRMARLLHLTPEVDAHGEQGVRVIPFDDRAQAALLRAARDLEPRLGPGGDLEGIADWGNKFVGTVARVAALLHLADPEHPEAALDVPVSEDDVQRALRIGEYLVSHALAAFGAMGADPALDDASHALDWIRRTGSKTVTRRDIQRAMPTRFRRAKDVDPALAVLDEHGFVRRAPSEPVGDVTRGRPPGLAYDVHPDL